MSKNFYLPRADEEKAIWLHNFAAKLNTFATKYDITPEEMMDMQQCATYFDGLIKYKSQFNAYLKAITDHKNTVRDGLNNGTTLQMLTPPATMLPMAVTPGIFVRTAALANRIKASIHYTKADGNDLRIEGVTETIDTTTAKPAIKIRLVAGGHPEIVWTKQGMTAIEIQKQDENGQWHFLAMDTIPNYIDMTDLPATGQSAVWKYRAIYRLKDERVGQWSDVVSVTVAG